MTQRTPAEQEAANAARAYSDILDQQTARTLTPASALALANLANLAAIRAETAAAPF